MQISYGLGDVRPFSHMAVKVPKPEGVDELKAEVEALSKLAHENVVAILGMVEGPSKSSSEKRWMMCLEYCETDLFKLLYSAEHEALRGTSEYSAQLLPRLCRQIVAVTEEGVPPVESSDASNNGTRASLWRKSLKVSTLKLAIPAQEIELLESVHEESSDEAGEQPEEAVGPAADVFSFGVMLWQMASKVDVDQWKCGWKLKPSEASKSLENV